MSTTLADVMNQAATMAHNAFNAPATSTIAVPNDITDIKIGKLLAKVIVIAETGVSTVKVQAFGDREMVSKLRIGGVGTTLDIEGELPFKPGSKSQTAYQSYGTQTNTFGRRKGSYSNSGVRIGGISVGGVNTGTTYLMTNGVLYINDRELDLNRVITLIVTVPRKTNIQGEKLIGAISLMGSLDGTLAIEGDYLGVHAQQVKQLDLNLDGASHATVRSVVGPCQIKLDGSARLTIDTIIGKLHKVKLDSSTRCTIENGTVTGKVTLKLDGSSELSFKGSISGIVNAKLDGSARVNSSSDVSGGLTVKADGSSSVTFGRVGGVIDLKLDGSAEVTANGHTYHRSMISGW